MNNSRISVLDSLRGIAAMAVVIYHSSFHFYYGRYGVQLFFIISGFVIFKTVESTDNVKDFIIKRFFRLYPTYWLGIIITTLFVIFFSKEIHITPKQFLFNLTMLQEHFKIENIDKSYWSLTPEIFFYFYLSVLIFFKATKKIYTVCIIWIIIILLNYIFKIENSFIWIKFFNIRHGQLFIAGIMFYRIYYKKGNLIKDYIMLAVTFIVSMLVYTAQYTFTEIAIIIPLTYGVFMLFIYDKLNFLKLKPLLFLGTISYPLYLINNRISTVIKEHYDYTSNPFLILILILCFVFIAYIMHLIVELPSKKITEKLLSIRKSYSREINNPVN